ncbi:DUF885 family protein [Acidobacteriota bacterium]
MKKFFVILIVLLFTFACRPSANDFPSIIDDYLEDWKKFYPTEAFQNGDRASVFQFEDFSDNRVEKWINSNRQTLSKIEAIKGELSFDDRIDADLLSRHASLELERWVHDDVLRNSSDFYYQQISGALTYLLVRHYLTLQEKRTAVLNRLAGIRELCHLGGEKLRDGRPTSTRESIRLFEELASFFEQNLPDIGQTWMDAANFEGFRQQCLDTAECIRSLINHIQRNVIPMMTMRDGMGSENYARKLRIFSLMDLTPERLSELALEAMRETNAEFHEVALQYWKETDPDKNVPEDFKMILEESRDEVEGLSVSNVSDFLNLYRDLAERAEIFVQVNHIATMPPKRTFSIQPSPQQLPRWGGVFWAGPFDPDATTIFYIPRISDDSPELEKEAFYRRYNIPLSTVLIAHELFPGHYLQGKYAANNPRIVRSVFYDYFHVEGYATLCQKVMLDEGWGENNKLFYLAHLLSQRRVISGAIYSVKVHCEGWDIDRAAEFAVKNGLIKPEKSEQAWYRVMNGSFEILSYFLGYKDLNMHYMNEKERLGDSFVLQEFMDKLLETGAVPMYAIPEILKR